MKKMLQRNVEEEIRTNKRTNFKLLIIKVKELVKQSKRKVDEEWCKDK